MFEPTTEIRRLPEGATLLRHSKLCMLGASKLIKPEKDRIREAIESVTLSCISSPALTPTTSEDSDVHKVNSAAVTPSLAAPLSDDVASADPAICICGALRFGRLQRSAPER